MGTLPDSQHPEAKLGSAAFELEEYKQVLNERQFVMTRYMQAVGLYLTLSGFALRELLDAPSSYRVWILSTIFTALNLLAVYAAWEFRNMAHRAMKREVYFVDRYSLQQTQTLFWGYWLGIALVCLDQSAVLTITAIKLVVSGQGCFTVL